MRLKLPARPAAQARRVLAALLRIGWSIKRQSGSHRTLAHAKYPDFVFAFHDNDENRSTDVGANRQAYGAETGGLVDQLRICLTRRPPQES